MAETVDLDTLADQTSEAASSGVKIERYVY